jgi:hypothetical protein
LSVDGGEMMAELPKVKTWQVGFSVFGRWYLSVVTI